MKPLFTLMVRTQLTRGRAAALVAFSGLGLLLAVAARQASPFDRPEIAYGLVENYAVAMLAPVTALIFSSSVLGDPVDDRTLVYLWLRPVARWRIAITAALASLTMTVPFALVPPVAMAFVAGADSQLALSSAAATLLAVVAYGALFVGLGLVVRRALVWGLAYILIWEGFVARSGTGASRFSVLYYVRSLLADVADHAPPAFSTSLPVAVTVPLLVALAAVALTTWALTRIDVA